MWFFFLVSHPLLTFIEKNDSLSIFYDIFHDIEEILPSNVKIDGEFTVHPNVHSVASYASIRTVGGMQNKGG